MSSVKGESRVWVVLANCFLEAEGGKPKDYEKAFELFSQAEKAGNVRGMNGLAVCLEMGYGTTKVSCTCFSCQTI